MRSLFLETQKNLETSSLSLCVSPTPCRLGISVRAQDLLRNMQSDNTLFSCALRFVFCMPCFGWGLSGKTWSSFGWGTPKAWCRNNQKLHVWQKRCAWMRNALFRDLNCLQLPHNRLSSTEKELFWSTTRAQDQMAKFSDHLWCSLHLGGGVLMATSWNRWTATSVCDPFVSRRVISCMCSKTTTSFPMHWRCKMNKHFQKTRSWTRQRCSTCHCKFPNECWWRFSSICLCLRRVERGKPRIRRWQVALTIPPSALMISIQPAQTEFTCPRQRHLRPHGFTLDFACTKFRHQAHCIERKFPERNRIFWHTPSKRVPSCRMASTLRKFCWEEPAPQTGWVPLFTDWFSGQDFCLCWDHPHSVSLTMHSNHTTRHAGVVCCLFVLIYLFIDD